MVYGGTAKARLQKNDVIQNKMLSSFTKDFRHIHNDVIYKDLNIRPFFDEIEHLALKFHRCPPLVRDPVMNNVSNYDPNVRRNKKKPPSHFD